MSYFNSYFGGKPQKLSWLIQMGNKSAQASILNEFFKAIASCETNEQINKLIKKYWLIE